MEYHVANDFAQYFCISDVSQYLDKPEVRRILGVDQSIGNFSSCSGSVGAAFDSRLDSAHPTHHYVAQLLERGIRILIYVGKIVIIPRTRILYIGRCRLYYLCFKVRTIISATMSGTTACIHPWNGLATRNSRRTN